MKMVIKVSFRLISIVVMVRVNRRDALIGPAPEVAAVRSSLASHSHIHHAATMRVK